MQGLGVDVSPSSLEGRISSRLAAASERAGRVDASLTLWSALCEGGSRRRLEVRVKSHFCTMRPLKPPPYVRFSALPHGVCVGGVGGVLMIIHSNVRH